MPKHPIRSLVFFIFVLTSASLSAQDQNRQLVQNPNQSVPAKATGRTALVIGNGAYTNANRLSNPPNDAQDVARLLTQLGFDLVGGEAHINQTSDQMKQLIKDFGEKLTRGGVGLFYYAGHGVQAQGRNYLIPIEANLLREKTLEFDAVDVNRVMAEMDAAGNGFNIVILDACRNNPFTRSWRSADQGLAQINAPEGTLIAYATSPGRVASDGTGRNGTYTAELLRQMRSTRTIEEMFKAVRAGVKATTNNQQTPWESSSLVGEFCLAGPCGNGVTAERAGSESSKGKLDPDAIELSYWDSVKNSANVEDFKAYLEKYPNGQFSSLAKNKVAALSTPVNVPNTSSPAADAVELAYWDSIKNSTDSEDFNSYLAKYPNGQFVDLARRRAQTKSFQNANTSDQSRFFRIDSRVRADSTTNGWTNTGLVVRVGQRIRISASGRVSLGKGITAPPEGLTNLIDSRKLMRNYPTGGLIAVIGDNNDDFIFIGNARDFVAPHDGVLFLGVNEGNLTDNSGNFDVVIEAEASGSR